jgi:thymidylate synthase (FAD)
MKYDPLGDSISSIEILYHMGDDLMVVNAARVSYANESQWEYDEARMQIPGPAEYTFTNPHLKDSDAKLIHYLAIHNHISPFFHPQIQFRIKMPIFVAREWMRSNIGVAYNEVSRRYVDTEPEIFVPKYLRGRAEKGQSKQGSNAEYFAGRFQEEQVLIRRMKNFAVESATMYDSLLRDGVAPEMARQVLPVALYTEVIMTASLHACARIYGLRSTPDVQAETRAYAWAMGKLIQPLFPVSWKELCNDSNALSQS